MPAAADVIADLAAARPTVTVMVTSRERLQLPGEQVSAVPPMSASDALPSSGCDLARSRPRPVRQARLRDRHRLAARR